MPELRYTKLGSPSAVYATALAPIFQGHPLWYPEPHGSGEVQLCDVGYIDDGAFVRVLNVYPETGVDRSLYDFWRESKFDFPDGAKPISPKFTIPNVRDNDFAPGVYKSEGLHEMDGQIQM